jgi:hypothetical protein
VSLIPIAAELIRRAAIDENYAIDLDNSIRTDEATFAGLLYAGIDTDDLRWLWPSEWLWFVRWRQSRGGTLQLTVLEYLESIGGSRASRFQLRYLVMRDPATEESVRLSHETPSAESVGLTWLERHARTFPDSGETARDALQVATEPAWFTLRVLTSLDDPRSRELRAQLRAFADTNEIGSEITSRWTSSGQL